MLLICTVNTEEGVSIELIKMTSPSLKPLLLISMSAFFCLFMIAGISISVMRKFSVCTGGFGPSSPGDFLLQEVLSNVITIAKRKNNKLRIIVYGFIILFENHSDTTRYRRYRNGVL